MREKVAEGEAEDLVIEVVNTLLKTGLSIAKSSSETTERVSQVVSKLLSLSRVQTLKKVPINLIQVVDGGVNPLELEKNQLKALADKNQKTKGRIESLKFFRDELALLVKANYPDLIDFVQL